MTLCILCRNEWLNSTHLNGLPSSTCNFDSWEACRPGHAKAIGLVVLSLTWFCIVVYFIYNHGKVFVEVRGSPEDLHNPQRVKHSVLLLHHISLVKLLYDVQPS